MKLFFSSRTSLPNRPSIGLATGAILAVVLCAVACDGAKWSGKGDGTSWSDKNNWSPKRVPQGSEVTFDKSKGPWIINVDIPVSIDKLHVHKKFNGTLVLNNNMSINGELNVYQNKNNKKLTIQSPSNKTLSVNGNLKMWDDGQLVVESGNLSLNGNVEMEGDSILGVAGGTFTANGNVKLKDDAKFDMDGGSFSANGNMELENDAVFDVDGGSFSASGNLKLKDDTEFDIDGGGQVTIGGNADIEGNADVDITDGRLRVDDTLKATDSSRVDIWPNGILSVGVKWEGNVYNHGGVLPVTLDRFEARCVGTGVLLSWHVSSELGNAGFHLWRRALERPGAGWVRVNDALIPGRITNPSANTYRCFDWPDPGRYAYRIEDVSVLGRRVVHDSLKSTVTVSEEGDLSGIDQSTWEALRASVEREARALHARRLESRFAQDRYGSNSIVQARVHRLKTDPESPSSPFASSAKAPTSEAVPASEGRLKASARAAQRSIWEPYNVAKVTHAGSGVLLVPQSELPPGYDASQLSVYRGGQEVTALGVVPEGLVLHAPGYLDDYTDRDVFFLRKKDGPTSVHEVSDAEGLFWPWPGLVDRESTRETLRFEEVYYNWSQRPLNYPPWFSSKLLSANSLHEFTLSLPDLVSGPGHIEVQVYSLTSQKDVLPDHELQLTVNGTPAGEASWDGAGQMFVLGFDVPAGLLIEGENRIELSTPAIGGVESQLSFLYSIAATYTKQLRGPGIVRVPGGAEGRDGRVYEVRGLDTRDVWVVDARAPESISLVPYQSRSEEGGSFTIRFSMVGGPWGEGDGILVVPRGQELDPESVVERAIRPVPQDVGYLAVGPAQFADAIQPLLDARESQNILTAFVDQEQLFDAYAHGRYGPTGIHEAVKALRPRFLLLLGRTIWDYTNRGGAGIDPLCPTFLAPTAYFSQAPCDAIFGDLGNGFPEVAVGRFPVIEPAELTVAVQRTLAFKVPVAPAKQRGLLVGDSIDPDPDVPDFHDSVNDMAAELPQFEWEKALFGTALHPDAGSITAAMETAADGDADIIFFLGHGSSSRLSKSRVLDVEKAKEWEGNVVLLQATCTANYFIHNATYLKTVAENLLVQPQGGISASIASTTYLEAEPMCLFMTDLLRESRIPGTTWGQAMMRAQQLAYQRSLADGEAFWRVQHADVARTESLLGDPALQANSVVPDFNLPPNAAISASPTSGTAPLEVAFDGNASNDPDGAVVSYDWAFGDGTTGSGASATHTYTTPGTYKAKLTVTDDKGATASTEVEIVVGEVPPVPVEDPPEALTLRKLIIQLRFDASGRDRMRFMGTLPVPDGFSPEGQQIRVDVGGVERLFTLDANGIARNGADKFVLRIARRTGDAKFACILRLGDFAALLADEGLVDETVRKTPVTVPVLVEFSSDRYLWARTAEKPGDIGVFYTARQGKRGVAKSLKKRR